MDLRITPEWVAGLRRDVKAWDARVSHASSSFRNDGRPWNWPDMAPPLKYTGSSAELGPGGRRRRASTSMTIGSGRHPPSEVYNWIYDRRVAVQMRLPVHVWATLSHGRESESVETNHDVRNWDIVKGVRGRERWREWDGERGKEWRDKEGEPRARQWTEWHVQRMEWTKRDGVWRGKRKWEEYDLEQEWDNIKNQRCGVKALMTSSAPWESVPQEVLLNVVHSMHSMDIFDSHSDQAKALSAAGLVCRAWFAICAPDLYHWIPVRSSRVKELTDDVSKPGSRIAQHTEKLTIRGRIPWTTLSRLLKQLPRLDRLQMGGQDDGPSMYHCMDSHMLRVTSVASRATLTLTSLDLYCQRFSSTLDILRLLASFPYLLRVEIHDCRFRTASPTAPLVRCTRLRSVSLSSYTCSIQGDAILSLLQWWRWPHSSADPDIPAYPGVHLADGLAVFGIMRSIPFEMLKCNSVEMSVEQSWRTGLGVLFTDAQRLGECQMVIQVELHVAYGLAASIANARVVERGARVEHIVIRLNIDRDLSYYKILESLATPMASLPSLRTVTLETPDPHVPTVLAGSLQILHAMGMLRLRTCQEAQQVAQAVMQNPSGYSEDRGVVSPLWYSEELNAQRYMWLGYIADAEKRRKTASAKSAADAGANTAQMEASTEHGESAAPAQGSVDSDAPSPDPSSSSPIVHEPTRGLGAQAYA